MTRYELHGLSVPDYLDGISGVRLVPTDETTGLPHLFVATIEDNDPLVFRVLTLLNAPDLTALVDVARAVLDWLGPVEKSPPLLPGSGLSEDARLVAERNVLRRMLAEALAPYEQKERTP